MELSPTTLEDFISTLSLGKWAQYTDLRKVYSFEDIKKLETDVYFVAPVEWGIGSWKWKRAQDSDIKTKNYMVIDFDIREFVNKNESRIIDDFELFDIHESLIKDLNADTYLSEWTYFVYSWNGYHVYYVGDELEIEHHDYSLWVKRFYDYVNRTIWDKYWLDKACSNISRVMRLPETRNYWRKRKYNLDYMNCDIMYYQKKVSRMFNSLQKVADDEKKKRIKRAEAQEKKYIQSVGSWQTTYDWIMDIPVSSLFCGFTGIGMARDWRNFISPRDGSFIGCYYDEWNNVLVNVWTRHLKSDLDAYSPFSYIKYEILETDNDKEVFDWARDNFSHIKELSDKERVEYLQKKDWWPIDELLESSASDEELDDLFGVEKKHQDITWWLPMIDKAFWKPAVNDLVLFAALAASGKTAFCYFMWKVNARQWVGTAFYTLELNPHNLKTRTAYQSEWLSKFQFQEKMYTQEQARRMREKYHAFDDIPNFDLIGFKKKPSVQQLMNSIRDQYNNHWKILFFIDNLWNITGSENENRRFEDITSKLQSLKNELPICIILIHHMSKAWLQDLSKPIWLAWFRGSMKIIDNATIAVELWRDRDEELPCNNVILSQLKDTFWGLNAKCTVEYKLWEYVEPEPNSLYTQRNKWL